MLHTGLPIEIRPTDPLHPQVAELLAASDAYMAALYPAESNHLEPPSALAPPQAQLFGAWQGLRLLGCGAFKRMRAGAGEPDRSGLRYGEVKRVFVRPEARGRGLSRGLMAALHAALRAEGIGLARLETGIHQPEALALYAALGYRDRPPFGAYRPDPLSRFMEKPLGP